ncbi:hypothetical protein Q1695_015542 [Nippostrongylus brasiliensis]|nr:hypothetical protein Q1695_015542 [Nippostrongylus brasiliensis]
MRLAARVLVLIVVVVGCNTTSRAREQLSSHSVTRKVTHARRPSGCFGHVRTAEGKFEASPGPPVPMFGILLAPKTSRQDLIRAMRLDRLPQRPKGMPTDPTATLR